MSKPLPLPIWDRSRGELIQEFMEDSKDTYESRPNRSITQWIKAQPFFDYLYALLLKTRRSAQKIEPFIRRHHINIDEFEPVIYRNYAAFFVRRFRPGARSFPSDADVMGAFAEARYLAWDRLSEDQQFPVKGHSLNAEQILGSAERARPFFNGPVFLVRLAPVDYHHVHYFDEGRTLEQARLGHHLWTVNWRALLNKENILFTNERQINILQTRHFGRIAFVEVGAMTVGRIIQVHPLHAVFQRSEEKSVFHFGGSAIVMFGESGFWCPSEDILEHTKLGQETYIRLGEPIAQALKI